MSARACGSCDRCLPRRGWGWLALGCFALVLLVVFEASAWLDSVTSAPLAGLAARWQPGGTAGVLAKAVADGLVGLAGIVVPYMIPLMLLLTALEQAGVMERSTLAIDRAFHGVGLHGGVAVAFVTGLGCNVPAVSAAARLAHGRERSIAMLLVPFVPCSARSAIILALAGKYLGGAAVAAIFACTALVIALLGSVLARRGPPIDAARCHVVRPYALPRAGPLARETWERSRDVVTIVMPLLVAGSVILALLQLAGADRAINAFLAPLTTSWLGLPAALGVPLLFGVLRKELSIVMVFQALGTPDLGAVLDAAQVAALVLFLTFYMPCISTVAVIARAGGTRRAAQAAALSLAVALAVAGAGRLLMAT